jgi:hypothetical protein
MGGLKITMNQPLYYYFLLGFILLGALFRSYCLGGGVSISKNEYYDGPSPYVYEMHKLYDKIAKFAQEKYGFCMSGSGGAMMNGIHELELSFEASGSPSDDEVVNAFREMIIFIIKHGNENKIIREACDNKQLTAQMIDLFLVIRKVGDKNRYHTANYIRKKVIFKKHWYSEYRSEVIREVDLEI